MALVERLAILIDANSSGATREFRKLSTEANLTDKSLTRSQKAAQSAGVAFRTMGVLAGGVAVGALGRFASQSIDAASALEEVEQKARVVFGSSFGSIQKFAEETADAFNLSERAAYQFAGAFGQLFDSAGLPEKQAAEFSITLSQLAADLASFNDISVDEAFQKLRSGLSGEAEPLRQVGVFLSAAKVEAEAYASGIAEAGSELTEAQKIQARYNIILNETKTAQGDVARTSESLANRQRGLTAEMEDFKAAVGEDLGPVLADTIGLMTDMLRATGDLNDQLAGSGGLAGSVRGSLTDALVGVAGPVGVVVDQMGRLGEWFDYVTGNTNEVTAGMSDLNAELYYSAQGIADIEPATRGLVDGLSAVDSESDGAASGIEDVGDAAGDAEADISDMADAIRDLGSLFSEADAAGDDLAAAFDDLVNGAGHLRKEHKNLKGALDDSNGGMWAQNDAAREARESLRELASKALDTAAAQTELDGNTDRAARTTRKAREDFIKVARQMGLTRGEARAYANQLGLIPSQVRTGITLYGADGAIAKAARVRAALLNIPDRYVNVFVTESRRDATRSSNSSTGYQRAAGGSVGPRTYLVGEQGPELVTMRGTGTVMSNAKTRVANVGGGGDTYSITVNTSNPKVAASEVVSRLRARSFLMGV